jgi:hypothetical protein
MQKMFISLITIIIIIYSLFAYYYNFINTLLFVFIFFVLFFLNIIFQKVSFNVSMTKWRLFAIFASITTSFSLLINSVVFLRNEETSKRTNLINFNKSVFDVFKEINGYFITYRKELNYMYNSIFGNYKNINTNGDLITNDMTKYSSNNIGEKNEKSDETTDENKYRDINLEFQQALIIYRGLNDIYISGNLEVNKDKSEYKGIINTFNVYSSSNLMRDYWKKIKYSLSPEFIKFMENNIFNKRINTSDVYIS